MVHRNSCSPCVNAARRACPSGSSAAKCMSTPTRRIRSGCCARAASGHAAAAPPSSVMKSRRLPRNSIQKIPVESMTAVSSMRVRAAHGNSFNYLVGALLQKPGQIELELLRGGDIDDQQVFGSEFDGQVRWFGALEDLVDVGCGSPREV